MYFKERVVTAFLGDFLVAGFFAAALLGFFALGAERQF